MHLSYLFNINQLSMKKIITILGSVALSFGLNAQSSVLLSEDFTDGMMDASLSSTNPNSVRAEALHLQFNSVDLLKLNLGYMPNPNGKSADSITVTYDVSFSNPSGGFDGGKNSLFYVDHVSQPFPFGGKVYDYQLYLQGEDFKVGNVVYGKEMVSVTKGFTSPFADKLSLIDFGFLPTYMLGEFSASTPTLLAAQVCPANFTNPIEIAVCQQQVIANAPSIQNAVVVDNIVVTSHKITGIEGGTNVLATPVAAFNLLGREIALDTKNEVIIVIFSDGSSARQYNK